jgi:galactokinase
METPRLAALLREDFERAFAIPPARLFRAPGRVNLIGEHTDYNDGFVLPAAIEREVLLAAAPAADATLQVSSADYGRRASFDLRQLEPSADEAWANYVAGVAWALREAGHELGGARIAVRSTVPSGAGLSSSAALELATAIALTTLFRVQIERPLLARLCQRAENEFVGMPCGIMDQFIAALGRAGHALLLDCRSLEFEQVPVRGAEVVVIDSGVRRQLVDSAYGERRRQCEAAAAKLAQAGRGIRALRDVTLADLKHHAYRLSPVELRRARHVVSENERTLQAAQALEDENLEAFGRLMVASHHSLRDDYEVSCPELDLLVELALATPGVYGSRLTGAGFGGCTVTLAQAGSVALMQEELVPRYRQQTGSEPMLFATAPAAGASEVIVQRRLARGRDWGEE